jgi:hypothetical protein
MGLVMFGLFVFMLSPVALYAWYAAIKKPRDGRAMQERVWKPLADRIGARWVASTGATRFHAFAVRYGTTEVIAIVHDRAAFDRAVSWRVPYVEQGGWRTFVQASVVGGVAPAFFIRPGEAPTPLLDTPPQVIASSMVPQVMNALGALGNRYRNVVVGPSFVSLELPRICDDAALLEAALHVVGMFAQPRAAAA